MFAMTAVRLPRFWSLTWPILNRMRFSTTESFVALAKVGTHSIVKPRVIMELRESISRKTSIFLRIWMY